MNASFAHIRLALQSLCVAGVLLLTSCASLPAPTAELTVAQQAVSRADVADADQYAPDALATARADLRQAQAAMAAGREAEARTMSVRAAAAADLAHARSRQAQTDVELAQRRAEIAALRTRLNDGGGL